MIIPCNCFFSYYTFSSSLNQKSSCCACMNWYLSSWVPGSTEEDVRYTVPMSRHRQSPFSTRWVCISHIFLGGVLKMHPIKDCGPRRIFSKACWEKEQVEHRRTLSLQSNAGIACWLCFLPVDHTCKANHSKSSILLLKTPPGEVYIQLVFVLSELHWKAWTFDEFVKMMMWDTREIRRKPQFIKLSMTSIRFHHSACCWTKTRPSEPNLHVFGFNKGCKNSLPAF